MESKIDLVKLIESVKNYMGLKRKNPIGKLFAQLVLDQKWGAQLPNFGDDAAVIPNGDHYLLLSADGMMPSLIKNEPYAAGKAAVMVCVNDIYATGGRPLAMVNVLGCNDEDIRDQLVQGLRKGSEKLKVPMVGGHLHPDSTSPNLSVAILGIGKKLLRSHLAVPDQDLIVAIDLDGRPGCRSVASWDTNSGKTSEEVIERLELLPMIAEKELSSCCKDISNAGLLGTMAIMMENSGVGAIIDPERIPIPTGFDFIQWSICFQSYGFVLALDRAFSKEVIQIFKNHKVAANVVGKVISERKVIIGNPPHQEVLFDFDREKITGISCYGIAKSDLT
jgi:selenophosphate synthetase-related protein